MVRYKLEGASDGIKGEVTYAYGSELTLEDPDMWDEENSKKNIWFYETIPGYSTNSKAYRLTKQSEDKKFNPRKGERYRQFWVNIKVSKEPSTISAEKFK